MLEEPIQTAASRLRRPGGTAERLTCGPAVGELPSVTVIIPARNEEGHIRAALASLSGQPVHELIVVDGVSADGTVDAARRGGAIVIEARRGRAKQMNAGAKQATGKVLLFLHADCTLAPGALVRLRRILSRGRHAAGYFRQRIAGRHPLYRLIEFGSNLRARFLRRPYGDQAIFVRRDVFLNLGGFPGTDILEDLYFVRRIRRFGPLLAMPEVVSGSARRWERDGRLRRMFRNWSVAWAEMRGVPTDQLLRLYEGVDAEPEPSPTAERENRLLQHRPGAVAKAAALQAGGPMRKNPSNTAPGSI